MAKYLDCSLVVACSLSALFEDALENSLTDAINDALNLRPKTKDDLADQDFDLYVAGGTLSVVKVGPQSEQRNGWLRASVYGQAERDTYHSIYADPECRADIEFTARIRLRCIGKQL